MRSIIPPWRRPSKARTTADAAAPGRRPATLADLRGLVLGYWTAVALAMLPVLAGTTWSRPAQVLLAVVAAAAVVAGVVLHAPAQRWPWVAVAAAVAAWAVVDRIPPAAGGLIRLA
ncbi:MAG: hypothetical protein IRY85_17750, partial [Micromonosporaceae bacterium]|nr:hypothetical protein [Micromonosporaceae bacterium]